MARLHVVPFISVFTVLISASATHKSTSERNGPHTSSSCKDLLLRLASPAPKAEIIFPLQKLHAHGSCTVECPNGDLLACWYIGSGERSADDVKVMGARMKRGSGKWSAPFLMADTPGFPDCNSCMVIDPQKRLWLFWPVILDNHWESAITKYQISVDYQKPGPPKWIVEKDLLLKPGSEFEQTVERDLQKQWDPYTQAAIRTGNEEKLIQFLGHLHEISKKTLQVRLGWMPRVHPFIFDRSPGKFRLIVPLYSDAFDFSLMAITDDWGATWQTSAPLVGPGNVQPSIVIRKDRTLVAYFRDNGPPPKRVMMSESKDQGMTWSPSKDIDLPNPGSGLEAIVLKSGRWVMISNDTERGRHSLAVSVSEDEGKTWPITRHIEHDEPGPSAGSYSYPSIIQARDGTLHATYSYTPPRPGSGGKDGESIKHVQLSEAWILGK
jgi:predicted neuraminidase